MGNATGPWPAVSIEEDADPVDVSELRWLWAAEDDPAVGEWQRNLNFVAAVGEWAQSSDRTIWIARVAERAVGLVCLTEYSRMPSPRSVSAGRWGYLGHLYVREENRGMGIGGMLTARVVQAAGDRCYSKLVLSPTPQSIPLYSRSGFTLDNDVMVWRPH